MFDELTIELTGETKAQVMNETEAMMAEIATLRALLTVQAEVNKTKDKKLLEIAEEMEKYKQSMEEKDKQMSTLNEDIKTYQKASEEGYIKRHAANEAYTAELEEAYAVVTKQREVLQGHLAAAHIIPQDELKTLQKAVKIRQEGSQNLLPKQYNLEINCDDAQKPVKAAETKLEAVEQRLVEAENDIIVYKTELIEMREYANHAVTMANNAWRDGADTIEYLRAQLYDAAVAPKGLVVKEWCVAVGGSSAMVSDIETWKSPSAADESEKHSFELMTESDGTEEHPPLEC
ncbi:Nn.00g077960.m01.CDS01 [Neocucurbitaria sp. VM-36]